MVLKLFYAPVMQTQLSGKQHFIVGESVTILADDTHIMILLLHHVHFKYPDCNIFLKSMRTHKDTEERFTNNIHDIIASNKVNSYSLEMDNVNDTSVLSVISDSEVPNSSEILKKVKLNNVNRLVIRNININSLRNKYEYLKTQIKGNIDILVITESKLDKSFPTQQFAIEGYSLPYRFDRNINGGGVVIYIREDIPCKELTTHPFSSDIEGIFLEVNLRKSKWLVFGGYNNNKLNTDIFLSKLGPILDHYLPKFDNFLLLGDFNSEIHEIGMSEFCDIYNLPNLITDPTCFKNPLNQLN